MSCSSAVVSRTTSHILDRHRAALVGSRTARRGTPRPEMHRPEPLTPVSPVPPTAAPVPTGRGAATRRRGHDEQGAPATLIDVA